MTGPHKTAETGARDLARAKEDQLLDSWIEARVKRAPATRYLRSSVLYDDYKYWLEDNVEFHETEELNEEDLILSRIRFGLALNVRKFYGTKINGYRVHRGLKLREEVAESASPTE